MRPTYSPTPLSARLTTRAAIIAKLVGYDCQRVDQQPPVAEPLSNGCLQREPACRAGHDATATAPATTSVTEAETAADQAQLAGLDQLASALTSFQTSVQGLTAPAPDPASLQSAAQDFVTAYNNLYDTLQSLTGENGALAGDATAQELSQELGATYAQSYSADGFTGLSQIGIDAHADGHLALDSGAVQSAAASDLTGAASVLSQAATAFGALAQGYGGTGGIVATDQALLQNDVSTLQFLQGLSPAAPTATGYLSGTQQYTAALQLQINTDLLGQSGLGTTGIVA